MNRIDNFSKRSLDLHNELVLSDASEYLLSMSGSLANDLAEMEREVRAEIAKLRAVQLPVFRIENLNLLNFLEDLVGEKRTGLFKEMEATT